MPVHFSGTGALEAKARAVSSWPAASTFTPNASAAWTARSVREPRSRQAEHHHRVKRKRRDRVGRRARRAVRAGRRHDGHARRQQRHRLPEGGGIDLVTGH